MEDWDTVVEGSVTEEGSEVVSSRAFSLFRNNSLSSKRRELTLYSRLLDSSR